MSIVDNRVVKMVFDNADFERNVGTTLSSLTKLKSALKFDDAAKGLMTIGNAAKNVSLDALDKGVYTVQNGFSALEIVATRVLQRITDKALDVGTSLIKAVTIAPLKSGLEEYETQINSVQTILANTNDALISKGLTTEHERIERINDVLDNLNHYADMTIYNFTEMTRNIGTFTAAGVDLDTAATSIKGIANLAAMSGSNSQQASTAMYQLSQAIASGSVKLQDWNSVVNAGMGGKLFQNELIDTAKAMGVVDSQFQALVNGTTTFRESLSSGWITAEVLTNTLEKFTAGSEGYTKSQIQQMRELWKARGYSEKQIDSLIGSIHQLTEEEELNLRKKWAEKGFSDEQIDHILSMGKAATDAAQKVKTLKQLGETVTEALQSGWTQSWEYIVGDFEQARMLWTEISDIMNLYIGKSADSRNAILEEWSRAAYSYNEEGKLIRLTYDEAGNLIKDTEEQIVEGGQMIREEMGGRELVIQSLRNTFQGLFEIAIEFGKAWDSSFWGKETDNDISITAQKLKDLSLALYDYTSAFKAAFKRDENGEAIRLLADLRSSFDTFAYSARNGFEGIRGIFSGLGNILVGAFKSNLFSIDTLNDLAFGFSTLAGRLEDVGDAFKKHFGAESGAANQAGIIRLFNGLKEALESQFWIQIDIISGKISAFLKVIDHIIGPGETAATILGKLGDKLFSLGNAVDNFVHNEDVSKISELFLSLADSFNDFYDILANDLDFSGIGVFFNQLISLLNGADGDKFVIIEKVMHGLFNAVKLLMGVLAPFASAFTNVFGDYLITAVHYVEALVDRFAQFADSLAPSTNFVKSLYTLFEGLFTVVKGLADVVATTFISAWDAVVDIFAALLPSGESVNEVLSTAGTYLKTFGESLSSFANGETDLPSFGKIIEAFSNKVTTLIQTVKNSDILEQAGEVISKFFSKIKETLFGTSDITVFEGIIQTLKNMFTAIKEAITGSDGLDIGDIFASGGIGFVILKIIDLIKGLVSTVKEGGNIAAIVETITGIGDVVVETFGMIQDRLKFDSLESIAKSMLMIAGAVFILSLIDPMSLTKAVAALAGLFDLMDTLLTKLNSIDNASLATSAAAIASIGTALLFISGAIFLLGNMQPDALVRGLLSIIMVIGVLTNVAEEFSNFSNDLAKGAGQLILLAVAVDLLTISVRALGKMSWEDLAKGLLGTIGLIYGLARASEEMSGNLKFSDGAGLLLMAVGIRVLASAVKDLSTLSWGEVAKGLVTLGISVGIMVAALNELTKNSVGGELIKTSASLLLLAIAIKTMSSAILSLAGLNWSQLATGIAGFALGLAAMTAAVAAVNKYGSGGAAAAPLAALAASMLPMAYAIKVMGNLSWGQIIAGLVGMGGALAIFVAAAHFITPVMAAGMLSVAGAIALLGVGVMAFSAGLAAIGVAVATSGASLLWFLQQLLVFLPSAATAFANAIGAFLSALASNSAKILTAISTLLGAVLQAVADNLPMLFAIVKTTIDNILDIAKSEIPKLFDVIGDFFDHLWPFLNSQIPNFFSFLTNVFTSLMTFIRTNATMLVQTVSLIIDTVLQAIIVEAPRFGQAFLAILQTILTVIQTSIPMITATLASFITGLVEQLAVFAPQLAAAGLQIIWAFLTAIAENIGMIVEAAVSVAVAFMNGLSTQMPILVDAAFNLIISFVNGLAIAIENNSGALTAAGIRLVMAIVNAVLGAVGQLFTTASQAISTFVRGITSGQGSASSAAKGIANAVVTGIRGGIGSLASVGRNLINGLISGIQGMWGSAMSAARSLADSISNTISNALKIKSPSRVTMEFGKYFVEGFIVGMDNTTPALLSDVTDLASSAVSALTSSIESTDYSPEITPVVKMPELSGKSYSMAVNIDPSLSSISANINANNNYLMDTINRAFVNNTNAIRDLSNNYIDYDKLGASVARSMLSAGFHVEMDSGQLVGYLAGEIRDARRMYG